MGLTVLLDCDGVLSDFLGGLLSIVNAERNTIFRPDDCTEWDIGKAFNLDWGYLTQVVERPGFCYSLDLLPGVKDAVFGLRCTGAEVFCVTSPFSGPTWMSERSAWLKDRLEIDKAHVFHGYTKRLVRGDVLVDDKPETIVEWAKAWPESTALLWSASYNRGIETDLSLPKNAIRVHRWAEVDAICRLLSKKSRD